MKRLPGLALAVLCSISPAQTTREGVYQQCAACHEENGAGGAGPALAGNNIEGADYHISRILNAGMPA